MARWRVEVPIIGYAVVTQIDMERREDAVATALERVAGYLAAQGSPADEWLRQTVNIVELEPREVVAKGQETWVSLDQVYAMKDDDA